MNPTITLIPGTAEVDSWAPVTDAAALTNVLALERDLHLFDEGKMLVWLVDMDTKYASSEAVTSPYTSEGKVIARFYPPHLEDIEDDWESTVATDFEITVPEEGEWLLRVLGGRYEHFIVLMRKD